MPALPPALQVAMGGQPPAGAGTAPGQPPFGSSPVTGPVPNRGMQGEGLALVAKAKDLLEKSVSMPGLGAESEIGQTVLKFLADLGKHLPDGAVTPGLQNAGMQKFMMSERRDAPIQAILAALQQGGGAGGAGAAPPAGPGGPLPAM